MTVAVAVTVSGRCQTVLVLLVVAVSVGFADVIGIGARGAAGIIGTVGAGLLDDPVEIVKETVAVAVDVAVTVDVIIIVLVAVAVILAVFKVSVSSGVDLDLDLIDCKGRCFRLFGGRGVLSIEPFVNHQDKVSQQEKLDGWRLYWFCTAPRDSLE